MISRWVSMLELGGDVGVRGELHLGLLQLGLRLEDRRRHLELVDVVDVVARPQRAERRGAVLRDPDDDGPEADPHRLCRAAQRGLRDDARPQEGGEDTCESAGPRTDVGVQRDRHERAEGAAPGRQAVPPSGQWTRSRCEVREPGRRERDEGRADEDASRLFAADERGDRDHQRRDGDEVGDLPERAAQHPLHPLADGAGRLEERQRHQDREEQHRQPERIGTV
jgi:hypothetical protein